MPYEVRRVVVGKYPLLFTNDRAVVYVIGLRHAARLPRPEDLPPTVPSDEE